MEEIKQNKTISKLKEYYTKEKGIKYSNIKVGIINATYNPWMVEYAKKIEEQNKKEDKEQTGNNEEQKEENNSKNNDSNENSSEQINDNWTKPELRICNDEEETIEDKINLRLTYSCDDREKDVTLTIKHNGKVIVNKKIFHGQISGEDYEVALVEGTNKIEAMVQGSKGNVSAANYTIKKKVSKPIIKIDMNEKETSSDKITLYYDISDEYNDEMNVIIKNNGKVVKNSTEKGYDSCLITLKEGTNKIEITAKNSKGKTATASYTITAKFANPELNIDNSDGDTTYSNEYEISGTIGGERDYYNKATIKVNGKVVENTELSTWFRFKITLVEGINKIEVTVKNSKGKTDTKSWTVNYVVYD